jgi:WD40 repeat protein
MCRGRRHDQEFLRGHDEAISALCISNTGQMIASGQTGSTHLKEAYAPVIVWDSARREEIYFLKGLMGEVVCVAFSPDGG